MFQNVPKCSKMFQNVPKCSKMFQNSPKKLKNITLPTRFILFFKVVRDPEKGQCIIASRKIEPLEVILSERPAVIGPYSRPSRPQCLNCFKLTSNKCSKCDYPICGSDCQNGYWHLLECQIFQTVNHRCDYKGPFKNNVDIF